jgi:hypothetical protein
MILFQKATKKRARARVGLVGPSGSGKTYTSLRTSKGIGGRVAVIDTERGSASKYADEFDFDVIELETFEPEAYIAAIQAAEKAGYDVLVIDSLSHAWAGKGGALEQVDNVARRNKGNSFTAWRDVTPRHQALVDAVLSCKMHVIATLRAKTEYILEAGPKGTKIPKKIGMAPVFRDGIEYEFDVVGDLDYEHSLVVTKTRCKRFKDAIIREAGEEFGADLAAWLNDGAAVPEAPPPEAAAPPPAVDSAAFAVELMAASDAATLGAIRERIRSAFTGGAFSPGEAVELADALKAREAELAEADGSATNG